MLEYPVSIVCPIPERANVADLCAALEHALAERPDFSNTAATSCLAIRADVNTPSPNNAEQWVKGEIRDVYDELGLGEPEYWFESVQPAQG